MTISIKRNPLRHDRNILKKLLGNLPSATDTPRSKLLSSHNTKGYRLEKWLFDLNEREKVPAYLTIPLNGSKPFPVVIFNHSHGGRYNWGKEEFIRGNTYFQKKPYAEELAERGIAGLCIDHWLFGERSGKTTESALFKEMLWKGQVLWGMMVYDSIRALDYIASRKDLDSRRIATLGMSMGSTMACWLAALDTRIKACVDICCMSEFDSLIESKGLDEHGIYYYVPKLLNHFSTADINKLIIPRPHLCLAGAKDPLTPLKGLKKVDRILKAEYKTAGAPGNWRMIIEPVAHQETQSMRNEILKFIEKEI